MKKIYKVILDVFIVLALFFILFIKVGIKDIVNVFVQMNLLWLIPFLLIFIATKLITTANVQLLLRAIKKKVPYWELFKYLLLTASLARYFPGRAGEVSLTILLRKHRNLEYGEGLSIQLIDKLITLSFFGILALYGLLLIFNLPEKYTLIFLATTLVITVLVLLLWSNRVRSFVRKFVLKKYSRYFKSFSKTFKYVITKRKRFLFLNILITIAFLSLTFVGGFFVFKAFGESVPIIYIAVISAILTMITFLPLPFSGLGVREISGVYLFSLLGVPLAVSTNYILFNFLFKYLFLSVVYFSYRNKL